MRLTLTRVKDLATLLMVERLKAVVKKLKRKAFGQQEQLDSKPKKL